MQLPQLASLPLGGVARYAGVARHPLNGDRAAAIWQSTRRDAGRDVSLQVAAKAAYDWLCKAQDATPDGGVSGWYDLLRGRFEASYPETTGYIIPTFLAYAVATGDDDARARALRMADWEIDVQLPTGAVHSGLIDAPRAPAVFNTGQCLFGFVAAYEETLDVRYREAALRAGHWLLDVQGADGAWRKDLSQLTTSAVQTYNARSAWGLALAGVAFDEPDFVVGAIANGDWVLDQQNAAGWFRHNAFSDVEAPLLHTVAYAIEGLVGLHALSGEARYLEGARAALDGVLAAWHRDGRFGGRYDESFNAVAPWRCLTGEAQIATVVLRLAQGGLAPDLDPAEARRMLADVARVQLGGPAASGGAGGIAGSFPVWGQYCSFSAINWATKFFLDGLMLELYGIDERSFRLTENA